MQRNEKESFNPRVVRALRIVFSGTLVASLAACAPAPQSISHEAPSLQRGPRLRDVDLKLDTSARPEAHLAWSGELSAAAAYRLSENLLVVQNALTQEGRTAWAQAFFRGLPQERTKLSTSAYADILIEQSQELAQNTLQTVVPKLKASPAIVRQILTSMKRPAIACEKVSLDELANRSFQYLRQFDHNVDGADLIPQVKSALHLALKDYLGLQDEVRHVLKSLDAANTIRTALTAVSAAAKTLNFTLSSDVLAKMKKASLLGSKADSFTDAHGALSLLVDVWVYLDPIGRIQVFKSASPELFDYLNGMSAQDLQCLQNPDCFNLPQWIAKNLVIEPKIQQYGLEKIRSRVNAEGASAVRQQVLAVVLEQVRALPERIAKEVDAAIEKGAAPILRLQNDFAGEVRDRLEHWAAAGIEKTQPSILRIRPSKARLRVGDQGRVTIDWTDAPDSATESTGALSSLSSHFWQGNGASNTAVTTVPPADARALVLTEVASLAKQYKDKRDLMFAPRPRVLSARAYAEAIRGAASLSVSFRDWEKNSVDDLLGNFSAQELFPEFRLPELQQPIFPKPAFFALSFNGLAEKLKITTGEKTQVFLIDANNHVVLANEPNENGSPIMAGIADRIGDQLAPTVRAGDVARYLIAMCETHEAARSIELSGSDLLLKPGKDGKVPRDEIIKNREPIRLLILGLANFLSHQFRAGGDLIRRELDIATQQPTTQETNVLDQALAIRALIAASNTLGNDIYRWESIDLVSAMNRDLYRYDLGFYGMKSDMSVDPSVLLETLRALDTVSPDLKPESQRQIQLLTAPWRARLANWHLDAQ